MLELIGALWAVYGLVVGFTSGVLEPVIDGLFNVLSSVGLMRTGGGYSAIETLVARGHLTAAAEAYAERARNPGERGDATLRRAAPPPTAPHRPAAGAGGPPGRRSVFVSPPGDLRGG